MQIDNYLAMHLKRKWFEFLGGWKSGGVGWAIWSEKVDFDSAAPEGPHRKAVPREVAQSLESRNQENGMDRGGGQNNSRGPPQGRQPVGKDRQTFARQNRQCNKKSLEQYNAAKVRGGGGAYLSEQRYVRHLLQSFHLYYITNDVTQHFSPFFQLSHHLFSFHLKFVFHLDNIRLTCLCFFIP